MGALVMRGKKKQARNDVLRQVRADERRAQRGITTTPTSPMVQRAERLPSERVHTSSMFDEFKRRR